MQLDNLFGISCDGEVTNTGKDGGVLRLFELHLQKPWHWFICLLHFNELPLRHLYEAIDGATSGPKIALGPISKALDE